MSYTPYKPKKSIKRPSRPVILLIVGVVLVLGAIGTALALRHNTTTKAAPPTAVRPINSVDYTPATSADNKASEDRKNSSTPVPSGSSGTPAPTPSFGTNITSSYANAANSTVRVGTLVSGTKTGTCTLTATQSGQPSLVKSSSVQLDVNYYDCGIFTIPFSDFSHSGNWKFTLTVTSGGEQASNTWPDPVTVP